VRAAAASKPVLAVCIGEQMLFERSEEGDTPGLGPVCRQRGALPRRRDAHAGRRAAEGAAHGLEPRAADDAPSLWDGVADDSWFYFVHSYYVAPRDAALTAGTSDYGHRFTCVVARDNIFATQFHPEKERRRRTEAVRELHALESLTRALRRPTHSPHPPFPSFRDLRSVPPPCCSFPPST
jgi:imidazole glycerol-phosphate synthase subunit HisH